MSTRELVIRAQREPSCNALSVEERANVLDPATIGAPTTIVATVWVDGESVPVISTRWTLTGTRVLDPVQSLTESSGAVTADELPIPVPGNSIQQYWVEPGLVTITCTAITAFGETVTSATMRVRAPQAVTTPSVFSDTNPVVDPSAGGALNAAVGGNVFQASWFGNGCDGTIGFVELRTCEVSRWIENDEYTQWYRNGTLNFLNPYPQSIWSYGSWPISAQGIAALRFPNGPQQIVSIVRPLSATVEQKPVVAYNALYYGATIFVAFRAAEANSLTLIVTQGIGWKTEVVLVELTQGVWEISGLMRVPPINWTVNNDRRWFYPRWASSPSWSW